MDSIDDHDHEHGHGLDHEEPTLPVLPADAHTFIPSSRFPISVSNSKRKRSSASQLFSDSSELAVFSSDDDPAPAVENYTQDRRKKQYVGAWDRQRPVSRSSSTGRPDSRAKRRRKLQRQLDSGIFMASDASASSIDEILNDLPPPPPAGPFKLDYFSSSQLPRSSQATALSKPEAEARRTIQQCLDQGDEYVDLSGLGLERVSNDTICLVSEFVRIPIVDKDVPFSHQDPEPKLFLYNNNLTRVPSALFDLNHLTVLSLRGNQLTELPPSIAKLTNLRELNVSQNLLRSLPFELLELIYDHNSRLECLGLHPNPFYRPQITGGDATWATDSVKPPPMRERGNGWLSKSEAVKGFYAKVWARTPVHYTDTRGRPFSDFCIDPMKALLAVEDIDDEPSWPTSQGPSSTELRSTKVFSLMELVLQTTARHIPSADWSEYLDSETHPGLVGLLEDVTSQQETGGNAQCTVCRRSVIRPTARWIEWWEMWFHVPAHSDASEAPLEGRLSRNPDERLVPFLRQACSWNCVRDEKKGLGRPRRDSGADPALEEGTRR